MRLVGSNTSRGLGSILGVLVVLIKVGRLVNGQFKIFSWVWGSLGRVLVGCAGCDLLGPRWCFGFGRSQYKCLLVMKIEELILREVLLMTLERRCMRT